MSFTVEDIGKEIECTYPQGTKFTTEIVEESCLVCGSTYIGPREEVAHLLAQHTITHGNEVEQLALDVSHLDDFEQRGEFESHIVGIGTLYGKLPAEIRTKVLASLKICLSRFASIRLIENEEGN